MRVNKEITHKVQFVGSLETIELQKMLLGLDIATFRHYIVGRSDYVSCVETIALERLPATFCVTS